MSDEDDSSLERGGGVEETLEVGFGEVEFEEIKIGFEVEVEDLSEDLDDEDLREFLALGFFTDAFGIDTVGGLSLEETLSDAVGEDNDSGRENLSAGDFYKTKSDVGDFYENDVYAVSSGGELGKEGAKIDYEGFVEMDDVNIFVESEVGRQSDRSVLEISGFRDEEAEKKRKEKRERFW